MANIGREFTDNYPRRKDGGWEHTNIEGMARAITDAAIAFERIAKPGCDPKMLHMAEMDLESLVQEARNMTEERYVLRRNEVKAEFIRHSDAFDKETASPFLTEE